MKRSPTLILILLLTGAAALPLFSQDSMAELERAWQEDRFDDLARLLPAAEKAYPRNPSIAFFRALVLDDADEAFASYKRVFESEELSRFADTALFKMAQYQYARERFMPARKYFQLLQKRFPQTRWLDDSLYLTGQCYLAEGKPDSARLAWNSLIKRFPRSPYCDMAVADLESSVWDEPAVSPRQKAAPGPAAAKPFYSIQVGAFSQRENARTILSGLEKVGYEGSIVEKKVGNRLFHAVWIGSFPDRESAEDYAKRFIVKVTREYSIVKSE